MKERIIQLKKALSKAAMIEERAIADKIISIGYKCLRCAKCCMEAYGDNTVSVFPFEIRRISEKKGLKWEDIAVPAPSEDKDAAGNIHTFEWVLKGNCAFLDKGLCEIYECRPYICRTYPFYLLEGRVMISECEGIGNAISGEDAMKIAALLKERYMTEIRESISLLEKFRGFKPGGGENICIHDSEGEHWFYLNDSGKI